MNKKGQLALVGLMIGIFVIIFGLVAANAVKDVIEFSTGSSQLDCSNSSITDGTKAVCLAVDLTFPYYILILFVSAGAWMTARWVMS